MVATNFVIVSYYNDDCIWSHWVLAVKKAHELLHGYDMVMIRFQDLEVLFKSVGRRLATNCLPQTKFTISKQNF